MGNAQRLWIRPPFWFRATGRTVEVGISPSEPAHGVMTLDAAKEAHAAFGKAIENAAAWPVGAPEREPDNAS